VREPLLHVEFLAVSIVDARDNLNEFERLAHSVGLQILDNFDRVLSTLIKLDWNDAFVEGQLGLAGTKVLNFASFDQYRLHSETIPFCALLVWVIAVHFIDDRLEVGWVQGCRFDSYVLGRFFKSKDSGGGSCPLRVNEAPLLIAESSLYLVKALVAWRVVKADGTEFKGIICNIELD